MTTSSATITSARAGYTDAPQDSARVHILTVLVEDRPGSVDRVVSALRRKRANLQSLSMGPADASNVMRITAFVRDAEISVDNLVEHIRKIFDVQEVKNVVAEQTVISELVLIKVKVTPATVSEIVTTARQHGAAIAAVTTESIVCEAVGTTEHVNSVIKALETYGIQEIARSGQVAIAR